MVRSYMRNSSTLHRRPEGNLQTAEQPQGSDTRALFGLSLKTTVLGFFQEEGTSTITICIVWYKFLNSNPTRNLILELENFERFFSRKKCAFQTGIGPMVDIVDCRHACYKLWPIWVLFIFISRESKWGTLQSAGNPRCAVPAEIHSICTDRRGSARLRVCKCPPPRIPVSQSPF